MQPREMNEQIGNVMLTLSTIKCPCWVPGGHRYKQQATQHFTWHSAYSTQDTDRHRDNKWRGTTVMSFIFSFDLDWQSMPSPAEAQDT